MTQITAAMVKELRDATGVGMMECKRALVETDGDGEAALKVLRERGLAIAGKKASRAANEGLVAAALSEDGRLGTLIEVNCETDFVARNETFQALVADFAEQAKGCEDDGLAELCKDTVAAKIAEIGENIIIARNVKFEAQGPGAVVKYIHLGAKVGVLLEIGCGKDDSPASPVFQEAAKDVTLHIAASSPQYLTRDEVPADVIAAESEIYAKQAEGKPEQIIEKIVSGKIDKFYSQICLVEQGFVKDPDQSIADYLAARGKEIDDTLEIRRYIRYQIGG